MMNLKNVFQGIMAALFVTFSITLIASESDKSTSSKTSAAIYTEDKQDIAVGVQQPEFTIKLKSNPSTGYSWFLREYDAALVAPLKHTYQRPLQQLVGAPGYELWSFRIKPNGFVVPHQTVIRFVYARPWQSADNSTQLVFRITTQ